MTPSGPVRLAVAACLALAAAACGPSGPKPDPLERAYVGLALDVESRDVCRRISPDALERAPFNSPGTRTAYTRSRCFFELAVRTLAADLCSEVRQAGSNASGGYFSPESCSQLVASGQSHRANVGFDRELVLRALGYREDGVPGGDWIAFYFELHRTGDFQRRLARLPDFSN